MGNICWLHLFFNPFLGWYEHYTGILFASQSYLLSWRSKPNKFHRFWNSNFTFSMHNCFDLLCPRVQHWQILLYIHYQETSMNSVPFSIWRATDQPERSSSILSIISRPVKFFGRMIDGSLSDRSSSVELPDKILAGLRIIDKSHFSCTQKLSIFQHLLILRIQ